VLKKYSQREADRKIISFLKNAGYKKPTILQKKVIPEILKGKNLIIHTQDGEGKTATFLISLLLKIDHTKEGIKAIILTSDPKTVRKIENQFRFFSPPPLALNLVAVGYDKNIKKELYRLTGKPDIIVGTTSRIIDHIRRENIRLHKTEVLVVDCPEDSEWEGFEKDVLYIISKLAKKTQKVIFTHYIRDAVQLDSIGRKAKIISIPDIHQQLIEHRYIEVSDHSQKPKLLVDLLFAEQKRQTVVMCKTPTTAISIDRKLKAQGFRCKSITSKTVLEKQREIQEQYQSGDLEVLILTGNQIVNLVLSNISNVIYFQLPGKPEIYIKNYNLLLESDKKSRITSLITEEELIILKQLQELKGMNIRKAEYPEEIEVIKGKIGQIVKRIREEEDPDELNQYKKLYKKHVPIFLRSYFTAYLLKEYLGYKKGTTKNLQSIFVSIGKNRKVYPKDLARLFSSSLKLKSNEIGNIKIFDSYSFIDIPQEYSEKAIELLDGKEFRGRKITVNYARKKDNNKGD